MGRNVTAKFATTSFANDTATKTGQSARKVRLDVQRARSIPKIADVVGTSLDKGEELDALAKLPRRNRKGRVAAPAFPIRGLAQRRRPGIGQMNGRPLEAGRDRLCRLYIRGRLASARIWQ